MKKYLLTLLLLIYSVIGNTQNLKNGSFEITTANCEINIENIDFNAFMPNCYAIGTIGSNLDILNNHVTNCNYGGAQDGEYYIGIAYNGNKEALSLELDTPLTSGDVYVLSFYNKKHPSWISNTLEIGYSTDTLTFGTLIDTISAPVNGWNNVILTFTPMNNSKFITVRIYNAFTSWNLIDNFSISKFNTNISNEFNINNQVFNHPNPFSDFTWIEIPSPHQGVYTLQILDIHGRIIKNEEIINNKIKINRNNILNGIYFYRIFSSSNSNYYSGKMIVE